LNSCKSLFSFVVEDEEIEEEEKKEQPKPEEILAKKVEEYLQSVERSRHVRPWDVGKEGVKPQGNCKLVNECAARGRVSVIHFENCTKSWKTSLIGRNVCVCDRAENAHKKCFYRSPRKFWKYTPCALKTLTQNVIIDPSNIMKVYTLLPATDSSFCLCF